MATDLEPTYDHDPLSEAVIGCMFRVANGLGVGFLEKVYEDAPLAQRLNFLKATGMKTCLLINFGTTKPQIRQVSR